MLDKPHGLYIHWPYCAKICPYCDFNVTRSRDVDEALWRKVFLEDIAFWAARRPGMLQSIYFGGGTPSLMPATLIEDIVTACRDHWSFASDIEITLEANPTDAESALFSSFAGAGINRLSMGVQSFDDQALKFLGRNHDAAAARRAIDVAMKQFPRTTFDLIYGLPNQNETAWQNQLDQAIETGAEHLSMYQLTIEQGTAFSNAVTRGEWHPIDDIQEATLYEIAQETCVAAGLEAYEVSNHAKPGAESLHNKIYWQYKDYIGIGPGAHGRITFNGQKQATEGMRQISHYLKSATPEQRYDKTPLSSIEQATEYLTMGLRLSNGVSLSRLKKYIGAPLSETVLSDLAQDNLIAINGDQLQVTTSGRQLLNGVLLALCADF